MEAPIKKNKKRDNFFVGCFINELLIPRLVFGIKKDGDTMEDFLFNRAIEQIKSEPINKFDAVSEYKPLVYAEVNVEKAEEARGIKQEIARDYKPKTSLENMIKYLKDSGYVVYRKQSKKKT